MPVFPLILDTQSTQAFAMDDLYELILEIRSSGLIGSHRYRLRNYKNTFVGNELVDWLVSTKNMCKLDWYPVLLLPLCFWHCLFSDDDVVRRNVSFIVRFFFFTLLVLILPILFSSHAVILPDMFSDMGTTSSFAWTCS